MGAARSVGLSHGDHDDARPAQCPGRRSWSPSPSPSGGAVLWRVACRFSGWACRRQGELGKELRVGFNYLESAPLFSIVPGLMITLVVFGFNFVGDGLRDALDPRLKGMGLRRR